VQQQDLGLLLNCGEYEIPEWENGAHASGRFGLQGRVRRQQGKFSAQIEIAIFEKPQPGTQNR
jgi:hypothetical protein